MLDRPRMERAIAELVRICGRATGRRDLIQMLDCRHGMSEILRILEESQKASPLVSLMSVHDEHRMGDPRSEQRCKRCANKYALLAETNPTKLDGTHRTADIQAPLLSCPAELSSN